VRLLRATTPAAMSPQMYRARWVILAMTRNIRGKDTRFSRG